MVEVGVRHGAKVAGGVADEELMIASKHGVRYLTCMSTAVLESVAKLPVEERIQLLDHLWASIAREIESQPAPASLLQELDRRDAAYEANPASGAGLDELESRLFPEA